MLSMLIIGINKKLNAYCVYNYSSNDKIWMQIFPSKEKANLGPRLGVKAEHVLAPNGGKACWNWKEIDAKNRKKEWYWKAYNTNIIFAWSKPIAEGYFPIGGAVAFEGYKNGRAMFSTYFDGKPWKK